MNYAKKLVAIITVFAFLFLFFPGQLPASLSSGWENLQIGRSYRKDFRNPDNWKDISEKYETNNAYNDFSAALNDFKGVLNNVPYSLEAKQGLAEAINEILQGQTLMANQRFIEATSGDKGYFVNIDEDDYLLEEHLEERKAGIEHALTDFDIGIVKAFSVLREWEFFDVFRRKGDVNPNVPKYLSFTDALNWPGQPEQNILCEYAQLTNALNRKCLASQELGKTLYRLADRTDSPEEKELAVKAFKETAHQAYLGALILAAGQGIEDFRENGGEQLKTIVADNRRYFENVQAGLTPDGTDNYDIPFIPYENVAQLENDTWSMVQNALASAQDARNQQRVYDQDEASLREELKRQRDQYLNPVEQISGFDPENYNELESLQNREQYVADIENKITNMLVTYPEDKDTEQFKQEYIDGFGELGPQIMSIGRAKIEVELAYDELQKIPEKIAIEDERAGKVAKIRKDNLEEYEALDVARGLAQSFVKVTSGSFIVNYLGDKKQEAGKSASFCSVAGQIFRSLAQDYQDLGQDYKEYEEGDTLVEDFDKIWKIASWAAQQANTNLSKGSKKISTPVTTKSKNYITSFTYDPTAQALRGYDTEERYLAVMEQVEILNVESEALVRNLLLETGYKAKVLERSQAVYLQEVAILRTKMQQLNNFINSLWEDRETAAGLYYNDPSYEIALTTAQEYAEDMKKRALDKLYTYGKSLEYFWVEPFEQQIRDWSCGLAKYVPSAVDHCFTNLSDVFWLNTAYECHYFFNALNEWDTILRNDQCARWLTNQSSTITPDISLKNHILGLRELSEPAKTELFKEFIVSNRVNGEGNPLNPNLELSFAITNKLLDDLMGDTWNRRISTVSVRLVGDDDINGEYNICQIRLTQGGCVNVKNFFNEIVSYNIQNKKNSYGTPVNSFEAKARINTGFGTPVPGYPNDEEFTKVIFKGKPLAASRYTFTIDTGLLINEGIRFDKIQDIQFRIVCNHDQPPVFTAQSP